MLQVQSKNLGSVAVLYVQGRIVNGETEILRDAVGTLSGVSAVILDMSQVPTIDARGLGLLLELREQVESNGVRFELTHVNGWVSKVLEITRLDTVFQITPMANLASCA